MGFKESREMKCGAINIPDGTLTGFCLRWKISRLELFGSALRDDFGPASDLDFLVTFENQAPWSLLDMVTMQDELAAITGRNIHLVSRQGVERSPNWLRRNEILDSAEPVYAP